MIEHGDFYMRLRSRIRDWARTQGEGQMWTEYLLLAPDFFHLLCRLVIDPAVAPADKARLAAAIAYFVSPIDLMPEALLGPIGFVDDIALAAYVLSSMLCNTDESVLQNHWAGDTDLLPTLREVLRLADSAIGTGLWQKVRAVADRVGGGAGAGRPRGRR